MLGKKYSTWITCLTNTETEMANFILFIGSQDENKQPTAKFSTIKNK
jgi:hypothetical protein